MVNPLRSLKVMHLNVQSISVPGRSRALMERLQKEKVDVCALQETWLMDEEAPRVEGFHWVGRNRPGGVKARGGEWGFW